MSNKNKTDEPIDKVQLFTEFFANYLQDLATCKTQTDIDNLGAELLELKNKLEKRLEELEDGEQNE